MHTENYIFIVRNAAMCGVALWLGTIPMAVMAQKAKLPDGPAKAVTVRLCGVCHGVDIAISRRESREGWNAIVDDMVQRGAVGTDDEFGEIVDYLAANFPKPAAGAKTNVNQATAKDLAGALGISDKQAAAIVHYREEKGKFKSFEDLAKVPGLDAVKIEAKKGMLAF